MTITIDNKDLFTMPQGFYLAHCVDAHFELGAGIAKAVNSVYNMRAKLLKHYDSYVYHGGDALLVDNVFNLVTKNTRWDRPTYDSLRESLEMMKEYMEFLDITKIAMPKIGCGRDGLSWGEVYEIIWEVFEDTDVTIVICEL
jgi:O-acetyl-ADP-ribose deacetylase (regulator of RNase III)